MANFGQYQLIHRILSVCFFRTQKIMESLEFFEMRLSVTGHELIKIELN